MSSTDISAPGAAFSLLDPLPTLPQASRGDGLERSGTREQGRDVDYILNCRFFKKARKWIGFLNTINKIHFNINCVKQQFKKWLDQNILGILQILKTGNQSKVPF